MFSRRGSVEGAECSVSRRGRVFSSSGGAECSVGGAECSVGGVSVQ